MPHGFDLETAVDRLVGAGSLEAAKAAFADAIGALGYHAYDVFRLADGTARDPVRPGNFIVASYDLGILSDFILQGIAADCSVLAQTHAAGPPFDYAALIRAQSPTPAVRVQRTLLSAFNVRHAWCVPLPEVGALRAVTVYLRGAAPEAVARFHATRHMIHLLSAHAMETFQALAPDAQRIAASLAPDVSAPARALSEREAQCLSWIASGMSNREVAAALDVSENTVRFHIKNIFAKLGVSSRAQAVAVAADLGLGITHASEASKRLVRRRHETERS